MNRYPLWRYLLILAVLTVGLIYSLPNLFVPDPALQITGQSSSLEMDEAVVERIKTALTDEGVAFFGEQVKKADAMIRFNSAADQLKAKEVLQRVLGPDYVVALNQAETTPGWLSALGAKPMKLGLDLSGGVHFLLQVDTDKVVDKYLETQVEELKRAFREGGARYKHLGQEGQVVVAEFADQEARDIAADIVRSDFRDFARELDENDGRFTIKLTVLDTLIKEKEDYAVGQNLTTLRNRVNELGVSEPIVQRQGRNRIVVELPGVQDTAAAKRIIGKTANLEFRLEAEPGKTVPREEFEFKDPNAMPRTAWLEKTIVITGDQVSNASSGFDENGQPQVNISLDSTGGRDMNYATRNSIGRRLGVLFIETRPVQKEVRNEQGERETVIVQQEEKQIISLATVRSALGVQFRITGLSSPAEASELALLLRAGGLAAPMYFVQERTIGPSLGAENIEMGINSIIIGTAMVVLFMLVIYRVFGIFANLALGFNLVLLVGIMSILGATLTLPGIAGIVLTLGMAVDANVLIFSRIKEEMAAGLSPQAAIYEGYQRAHVSIIDSNLTTIIVGVILYAIGSGPVQGFAVVLTIGILTSMFTALIGTRALVNLFFGGRHNLQKLWI
ncbi:MAG: preprotein translocase subunit SecD [Gammaproteobacteria bacterium BRH_c0]|nr:MAG: preprotein translocase subunit SecD [Gammaproteobacteria bacterium BRH_c0]